MKSLLFILLFSFSFLLPLGLSAKTILFLGDSLTEGYGIAKEKSYPQLLLKKYQDEGVKDLKFVNASISGSTTASAVPRLRWFLKAKPEILVLALGANDGLRGVDVSSTSLNLSKVIEMAQKKKIKVVLLGLRMPPNYGKAYVEKFESMFVKLAAKYQLVFIPKLLEGIAGEKELNQEDGIHPNEKGHQKMMEHIYPYLRKLL